MLGLTETLGYALGGGSDPLGHAYQRGKGRLRQVTKNLSQI